MQLHRIKTYKEAVAMPFIFLKYVHVIWLDSRCLQVVLELPAVPGAFV